MGDVAVPYGDLELATSQMASALGVLGVGVGDRVAVMLPNMPEFLVLYYGVLRVGGIVVPIDPQLQTREVEYYLKDSGASRIFALPDSEHARSAAAGVGKPCHTVESTSFMNDLKKHRYRFDLHRSRDADIAVIHYTPGTTGKPKGVALTHRNLGSNVDVVAQKVFGVNDTDVVLGCLPLSHVFGQTCTMNVAIRQGASLVLAPQSDPAGALDAIEEYGVTTLAAGPATYSAMLNQDGAARADLSTLRLCVSGGATLRTEVLVGFEKRFGCAVLEGYGLSEASPVVTFNQPRRRRRPGSVGKPIADVRVRLLGKNGAFVGPGEVGEILVRGTNVMRGYWRQPEATAEVLQDGWLHTGDLATCDAGGTYRIVDRKGA